MTELHEFIIDYNFEGAQWSFRVFAKDKSDAHKRLDAIKNTGRIFGKIKPV